MPSLRVDPTGRYLQTATGEPFFYLGDTAWELFHRLDRAEADEYLRDRAAKGYTVIQAVVLAEFAGLVEPNRDGFLPLIDNDPARPNPDYFKLVDDLVARANELGLVVGMLPTWGDKVNKKWGQGPEIFTPANARVYGRWLGQRYREAGLIWISGGDRNCESDTHRAIYGALAEGLREGDGGAHLITYHPQGGASSTRDFHGAAWLDFNMLQSGHSAPNTPNYRMLAADYARQPSKPCLDGEPNYEDHPIDWKPAQGWFGDWDVRKLAWWGVLAGACGHTYGCHDIWQFWQPGRQPVSSARTTWRVALQCPGAAQVQYVRWLLQSRPYFSRIPDPELLAAAPTEPAAVCQAARDRDGSWAVVYSASGEPFTMRLGRLRTTTCRVWWFDPRNGRATDAGVQQLPAEALFTPPTRGAGQDWVLVLDDPAAGYRPPGSR
ncbi:MAG: glycoside hydrolase family 140 protein [Fimbriimonadaceae bacterium]|nr:glycoside hydrolase family 140 protein [Fimbriimonadaceae bacterium]